MDLFNGNYTLNKEYILRKSFLGYSLYNITKDTSVSLNAYMYNVLRLFLHNTTNLSEIDSYFTSKGLDGDIESVQKTVSQRPEFSNLFVKSGEPLVKNDIYRELPKAKEIVTYEFTPETIDLLITNRCNLNCPHCYRNSKANDSLEKLPLERIYTLIDEMELYRVRSLKITGGEPFLVPELFDIVKYASKKRIHLAILTNATIPLDKKWLNLLKSNNIALGVSLDGSKSESHDAIRGKGNFRKTINNLRNFSDSKINYSVTFSLNTYNFNEIEDVVKLVSEELNAKKITFNFVEEIGRAGNNTNMFSPNNISSDKAKDEIRSLRKKYGNIIEIRIADNHGLVKDSDDLKLMKDKGDLIICKAGHASLAIDANMITYPCIYAIGGRKEYPLENLQNISLIEAWYSSKLDLFRGNIRLKDLPKCSKCEYEDKCNLKYCRLRPVFEGKDILDTVSFCEKELSN